MKAKVTQVQLASGELIEGLLLSDGKFAIAVPQIATYFQFDHNQASRTLKRLLGEGFQFDRCCTELNPKAVNVLLITDFEKVIFLLSLKGNEKAIELSLSLIGLGLTQLFCDAFGIQFEIDERKAWIADRVDGKKARRSLTDKVKDYGDNGGEINYGLLTLNTYDVTGLRPKYDAWKVVYDTPKQRSQHPFRDTLDSHELKTLLFMEENAAAAMENKGLSPNEAILEVAWLVRK